jgi:acyl-coenzyme A thioesterase PaaI-like protein
MDPSTRREAASPYGEWAGTENKLKSYRYLASRPKALGRDDAEGRMRLRHDLRGPGSVLGAPLAIAMLDVAGINVDCVNVLALTQINVNLLDPALDVAEVYMTGRVIYQARTAVFTEARMYDSANLDRVIGFGTANWSIIVPTPPGFRYPEPGEGIDDSSDAPELWTEYDGRRRDDGRLEVRGLSEAFGTDRLHHGPIQVVTERAGYEAVAAHAGTTYLRLDTIDTTILRPCRVGPFVCTPEVLPGSGSTMAVRVEMHDEGNDNRLVAANFLRYTVAG